LLSIESVLQKYTAEPKFQVEFDLVADRVLDIAERLFQMQSVLLQQSVSTQCFIDVAAIPTQNFTARWQPPQALRITPVAIAVPPKREKVEVVLMHLPVPSDVFHFTYRMSVEEHEVFNTWHLEEGSACRLLHAQDVFDNSVTKHEMLADNKWNKKRCLWERGHNFCDRGGTVRHRAAPLGGEDRHRRSTDDG